MAFIVPVVRKDYNLYGANKHPASLSKTGRSNSTPIRVISIESIERNFAKQAAARRLRQNSSSVSSSTNSPASVSQRRSSRRISIRHLSSADSTESNATTDSKRRVRFGHCEEIEFDSLDSEDECHSENGKVQQRRPNVQNKRSSVTFANKPLEPIGARPRSVSLMNIELPKQCRQPSKLSTFLRLAKYCSPGN